MVQKFLIRQMPGRMGIAGDNLAYVGTGCNPHSRSRPRRPQLCSAVRCAPSVYCGVGCSQVEVCRLSLPLQTGELLLHLL